MSRSSTIIKSGTLSKAEQANLQPVEMVDLIMEAKAVLARAKEEAARMVADARSEAETVRRQAYEQGHARGLEEGRGSGRQSGHEEALRNATKEFEQKHQNLVASCRHLIEDIKAHRASWQAAARHDLVDLALAVAGRVARVVGERERGVVKANLREAVRLAGQRSQLTVVVHPTDAETARQFAPDLFDASTDETQIDVREEESVAPGGCRIEWGSGAVAATLETQLDRIASELRYGRQEDDARDADGDNRTQQQEPPSEQGAGEDEVEDADDDADEDEDAEEDEDTETGP